MPLAAKGTEIRRTLAFDSGHHRGIERIALRPVSALAGAGVTTFLGGGLFHGAMDEVPGMIALRTAAASSLLNYVAAAMSGVSRKLKGCGRTRCFPG